MNMLTKWKKAVYLASTVGIISLATYGIYHTADAYNDFTQSQTADCTLTSGSSSDKSGLVPGGTLCSPFGCAGCPGCVSLQYQQNIDALPSTTTQVEQIY
ncbi:MAG: hypothetical protein PHN78_07810 [Dehalococcoidales bacterium]|nr:hypothetical protein [Dehalococcoidales bacterium]